MSDTVCAWLSGNLFIATSDPQFVAVSAGFGSTWEDKAAHQSCLLPALGLGGRSAEFPRHPEICLQQPSHAGCLIGSVTESAFGGVGRMGLVDLP